MKLISTTEYVLSKKSEKNGVTAYSVDFYGCVKYAEFVSQPLTLGMFVPCDLEGTVMGEPDHSEPHWYIEKYQQAKERRLFDCFEHYASQSELPFHFDFGIQEGFTIEDLLKYKDLDLILTPHAVKKYNI